MAVIIPYGDAQAHGSIADSVCFRRHKARVVFQKKPHARRVRSPGQLAQQQRFKDAWHEYHSITLWTLEYLKEKALLINSTAAQIYLHQYLTAEIPSTIKNSYVKQITDLDIPELIGTQPDDILFDFMARVDAPPGDTKIASISDNANVFDPGFIPSPYDRLVITVTRTNGNTIVIPFDYAILIWYKNFSEETFINLIRLPEITIPAPPSSTPRADCQYATQSIIDPPSLPGAASTDQYLEVRPGPTIPFFEIGHRSCSPGTHLPYPNTSPTCIAIRIRFHNTSPSVYDSPEGWTTHFWWERLGVPDVYVLLTFPAFTLQPGQDLSLYLADDGSFYYDEALTQIARNNQPRTKDLFVAWDWSVYWDKEMTQLGNSPYFQPD